MPVARQGWTSLLAKFNNGQKHPDAYQDGNQYTKAEQWKIERHRLPPPLDGVQQGPQRQNRGNPDCDKQPLLRVAPEPEIDRCKKGQKRCE
jgi:hypothetical protein